MTFHNQVKESRKCVVFNHEAKKVYTSAQNLSLGERALTDTHVPGVTSGLLGTHRVGNLLSHPTAARGHPAWKYSQSRHSASLAVTDSSSEGAHLSGYQDDYLALSVALT